MEFAPSEHEPCVRCLQLGFGLCQPDFLGARVDGEEEIALMDDVPILEVWPPTWARSSSCSTAEN